MKLRILTAAMSAITRASALAPAGDRAEEGEFAIRDHHREAREGA